MKMLLKLKICCVKFCFHIILSFAVGNPLKEIYVTFLQKLQQTAHKMIQKVYFYNTFPSIALTTLIYLANLSNKVVKAYLYYWL